MVQYGSIIGLKLPNGIATHEATEGVSNADRHQRFLDVLPFSPNSI
jgi:hypothetical protein